MGIREELSRLTWSLRRCRDFALPRQAVFGWFSTHNLGDNAALWALKGFFVQDLAVITPQTYRSIPHNLKLLICGASGYINPTPAAHTLKFLLRIPYRRFPCVMVSAGLNRDYGDDDFCLDTGILREFLSQFEFLSVRDRLSQRFLQTLGFRDVVIIPDLVLTLPRSAKTGSGGALKKEKVGLVLASNNIAFQKNRETVLPFLVQMCDHVIGCGREILCIPFQDDRSSPARKQHSEIALALEIKQRLAYPEKFIALECMLGPVETLRLMESELRYMISMRLHGNVFAARAGIPFISLSYNEKHAGFLEMMGMDDSQIFVQEGELDLAKVKGLITRIEARHDEIATSVRTNADDLYEQAMSGLKRMSEACPSLTGCMKLDP
jgi:polysaccharide pyruvyl transferase WcaK-like protein